MTQTIYFKAVKVDSKGRLRSLTFPPANLLSLIYSTEEYTEAKVGGVLVFDNISSAISFTKSWDTQIWSCIVEEPIPLPPYRSCTNDIQDARDIWSSNRRTYSIVISSYIGWPTCSCAFKRIKLLTKVYENNLLKKEIS